MRCTYCDDPLMCEACGAEFEPVDQAQHEAMSRPEVPIACPACEAVLVCRWCKTPYDGLGDGQDDG